MLLSFERLQCGPSILILTPGLNCSNSERHVPSVLMPSGPSLVRPCVHCFFSSFSSTTTTTTTTTTTMKFVYICNNAFGTDRRTEQNQFYAYFAGCAANKLAPLPPVHTELRAPHHHHSLRRTFAYTHHHPVFMSRGHHFPSALLFELSWKRLQALCLILWRVDIPDFRCNVLKVTTSQSEL